MNVNILALCSIVLAGSAAWAAPPQRTAFDPNDPEKGRPIIPREEREKLGLSLRTWGGVVDPEVYAALDRLERTAAELKQRAERGAQRAQQTGRRDLEGGDAIRTLFGIRFEGTVYVQVHVKHEQQGRAKSAANKAAIKETQRRVLASLTAAEFFAPYLFETHSGFTGFATKAALDKLAKHPDVVGVCLDDEPIPERPPILLKSDLPSIKPDDKSLEQPGVDEGKVEADVYRALQMSDRVWVIIVLNTGPQPEQARTLEERLAVVDSKREAALAIQNKVLSILSADEFWLWSRMWAASSMTGFMNKDGLEKLRKHPSVRIIGVEEMEYTHGVNRRP